MTIEIRVAQHADLSTLLRFQQGIVDYERPMDPTIAADATGYYDIVELLGNADTRILVAKLDGESLGCCLGQVRKDRAWSIHDQIGYIGMVYVDSRARGQRLCSRMFAVLEAWFLERGVRESRLHVYADNPSALRAYEHAGMSATLVEMRRELK